MYVGAPQINRVRGFALAELIAIVALVCILTAFAVPRLVSLEADTRSASATALGGRLRAQAAQAHALWLAQGQPDTIRLDGRTIAMQHGYPAVSAIAELVRDTEGFIVEHAPEAVVLRRTRDGTRPLADCSVRYAGAASAIMAPLVRIETSGC